MKIRKIRVGFHSALALDHILETQEQIGDRGAFLKAVTVVGVFCAISQLAHKLRHIHIGGAGKGGNAVVVVKGTVVQGLGVGSLSPEEQLVPFPLMHIADHRGGVFLASGVEGSGSAGEMGAEVNEIQHHLQGDHHTKKTFALLLLGSHFSLIDTHLLLVVHLGRLAEGVGIDQNEQIQQHKRAVVGQVHGVEPIVCAKQKPDSQNTGAENLPEPERIPLQIGPVSHVKHHKAVQEAEPVGDHIGKVEAVPNVVQLPDDKADIEKQQQKDSTDLILRPDVFPKEEEDREGVGKESAV